MSSTPTITDAYMHEMLGKTKPYTVIILHKTPKRNEPSADKLVFEHGRRNFELRRDGKLCVICPISDETDVSGVAVFATSPEEAREIYDGDPCVRAGIFWYELHQTRSFPGDALSK